MVSEIMTEKDVKLMDLDVTPSSPSLDIQKGEIGATIYIDPVKERAAMKKFDKYVLPVSVIFLVLSALDRNNVS